MKTYALNFKPSFCKQKKVVNKNYIFKIYISRNFKVIVSLNLKKFNLISMVSFYRWMI